MIGAPSCLHMLTSKTKMDREDLLLSDYLDNESHNFSEVPYVAGQNGHLAQPSMEKEARVAVIVVAKLCSGAGGGSPSLSTSVPISENQNSVTQAESETACQAVR